MNRCPARGAVPVDGARDELLADAAFAEQHHRGVGRGRPLHRFEHRPQRLAVADDFVPDLHGQLQRAVLLPQLAHGETVGHRYEDALARKRLFDEVEGTETCRLHRVGNGAVPGDHRHRERFIDFADFGERFKAVHCRHLDVQQHQIRRVALDDGQTIGTGRRADELVVLVFQNHPKRIADRGLVVDNQDAGFHSERRFRVRVWSSRANGELER